MLITVKHLLKILPIDEEVRVDILNRFDTLTDDQKLEIREICWTMYFTLFKNHLKHGLEKRLLEVKDGKEEISNSFYQEIAKQVDQEFSEKLLKEEEIEQLEKVKQQLEKFKTQPLSQDKTTSSSAPQNQTIS